MKKKIIIFSLKSGYGHIATSTALFEYLKDDFDVKVAYIFDDVLSEIDFFSKITKKHLTINKIYNQWILQGYFWPFISFSMLLGRAFFYVLKNKITKLLIKFCKEEKADYVISVIPLVNPSIFTATKILNVPAFLIPTDISMNHFLVGISKYLYDKAQVCLMYNNNFVQKQLEKNKIPTIYVQTIGAVLRPDFFEEKNILALKQKLNITQNKSVIMILLGGLGSKKLIDFATCLKSFSIPAHFLFCIGKNETLAHEIMEITFNPHISYTIVSFTDRISDFMAVSDIIITKSGTLSVLEGLYMQKPLLLDATTPVLPWERYNHILIEKEGFGFSIKSYCMLFEKLTLLLTNKEELETIKTNLKKIDKKNGAEEIIKLLQKTK